MRKWECLLELELLFILKNSFLLLSEAMRSRIYNQYIQGYTRKYVYDKKKYLICLLIYLVIIVVARSILIIILGIGKLNPAEEIGIIQWAPDYPKIFFSGLSKIFYAGLTKKNCGELSKNIFLRIIWKYFCAGLSKKT